jgi:hypothetical protein
MLTSMGRCGIAEEPVRAHGADVVSPRAIGGKVVELLGALVAQGALVGSIGCEMNFNNI